MQCPAINLHCVILHSSLLPGIPPFYASLLLDKTLERNCLYPKLQYMYIH